MLAILAAICFVIAAFIAFFGGSVSVTGLIAIGLALLALHLAGLWDYSPWRRAHSRPVAER